MILLSDIHGCYKTLLALLKKCPDEEVWCAGDLVDRGSQSAEVVEHAIREKWKCVRGNHEQMMIEAIEAGRGQTMEVWLQNGGDATLSSYARYSIWQERHFEWIKNLPLWRREYKDRGPGGRDLLLTHAGIPQPRGYVAPFKPHPDALLLALEGACKSGDIFWHRQPILGFKQVFQVFGHTPQPYAVDKTYDYANIDTGCVYKKPDGYGRLTALLWPSLEIIQQENCE
jgi:serine/threonine protein phosphatase 1